MLYTRLCLSSLIVQVRSMGEPVLLLLSTKVHWVVNVGQGVLPCAAHAQEVELLALEGNGMMSR